MTEVRPKNAHMSIPDFGFPISEPMVGFPIPGPYVQVGLPRLVTYPDGTNHPKINRRNQRIINPIVSYPSMSEEHGKGHLSTSLLNAIAKGDKDPEKMRRLQEMMNQRPEKMAGGYGSTGSIYAGIAAKIKARQQGQQGQQGPQQGEGYEPHRENRMWRQS